MSLRRSESETEIHKQCAEDLVIGDCCEEKKPKSGMIDSPSQFSAPVPSNDDLMMKEIAELNSMLSRIFPHKDGQGSWVSTQAPQKDDLRWVKTPFLGEGGKGSLPLLSTQVPQAPGEEKFKIEMTKPLCEGFNFVVPQPEGPAPPAPPAPPCGICGGAHHHTACDLRQRCPTDKKVGNGFMVICFCGNYLIDGKCRHGCPPEEGVVIRDKSFYRRPLVSELFSTNSNTYI